MRCCRPLALLLLGSIALAAPAGASLLGRTIVVEFHAPTFGTVTQSVSVLVEEGPGDAVTLNRTLRIDPEADSIRIDLGCGFPSCFFVDGEFIGIVIRALAWDEPGTLATGVVIEKNLQFLDPARVALTGEQLSLNLSDLRFHPDQFVHFVLEKGLAAPPPPPVVIDIQPGDPRNLVLPGLMRRLLVAILGSEEVDPARVDLGTLGFGPADALPQELRDVNGDGRLDLVLAFDAAETGIHRGDVEACLVGEIAGEAFVACDSVDVRPAPARRGRSGRFGNIR